MIMRGQVTYCFAAICIGVVVLVAIQNLVLQKQISDVDEHLARIVHEKSNEVISTNSLQISSLPRPVCPPCNNNNNNNNMMDNSLSSINSNNNNNDGNGNGGDKPPSSSCPQCPSCPDCVCGGGGGGGGGGGDNTGQTLPSGIVQGIISSFLNSVTDDDKSPKQPMYLTSDKDKIGRHLQYLMETGDCSVVRESLSSVDDEKKRHVEVIAWMPTFLDYDVDSMSISDLAVALGFVENHELVRSLAERRMDAINKFKRKEYTQLAQAYGGGNDDINRCFGAQMEHRDELKKTRYLLLADTITVAEYGQSHNEILKKCTSCQNSAFCYTGGKEVENGADRLQQLADMLLRPTPTTFHWLGREQMAMLLKRQIAERRREIENILQWNLCHPSVAGVTLLVTNNDHIPKHLSHPRFHVVKIHTRTVSYSDAVSVAAKKAAGTPVMIVRADVALGEGIGEAVPPKDTVYAYSPFQAAPSLKWGVPNVEFCHEHVGGEHTAIAFTLPVKVTPGMYVSTDLPGADDVFLGSFCREGWTVQNPCKTSKVYHHTMVRYLRLHPQLGLFSRQAQGSAAVSCVPGVDNCCPLSPKTAVVTGQNEESWNALMSTGLYRLLSGKDEPYNPHSLGYSEADLLPLTAAAQKFIYDWQHPTDCNSAKFMRASDWGNSGIGSTIHTLAHSLGIAIDAGRVLVLGANIGQVYTTDNWCNVKNFNCFFLPLTHCPPESWHDIVDGQKPTASWSTPTQYVLPKVMERWLQQREVNVPGYYWWRGQAAAYLSRFNPRMREEMLRRRKAAWDQGVVVTPNTVSAHVRHGDKANEMRLVGFSDYYHAAATSIPTNKMFVSTEDPKVIEEAKSLSNWKMLWVDQRRDDTGPMQHAQMYGPSEEFLSSFLNLLIALECDSFVGTRGSNWNRLIDELRGIWSGNGRATFLEVGDPVFGW